MLARKQLPDAYAQWNTAVGAPFGHFASSRNIVYRLLNRSKNFLPLGARLRLHGPFSIQSNTTNRTFEYPWAFHVRPIRKGMRIVEIGGGLSGFQFALSRQAGCEVVNIDPGMEAAGRGWPCDPQTIAQMNATFGTNVALLDTTVEKADLPDDWFDYAFSISVIEHMPPSDIENVLQTAYRILKPGGEFILTVDLFLDVHPFTSRPWNDYGSNIDLRWLCELAPFELVFGNRAELYGFPEFDRDRVLRESDRFLRGDYPVLVQCLILRKIGAAGTA